MVRWRLINLRGRLDWLRWIIMRVILVVLRIDVEDYSLSRWLD